LGGESESAADLCRGKALAGQVDHLLERGFELCDASLHQGEEFVRFEGAVLLSVRCFIRNEVRNLKIKWK
jgi:hypothetical protein